MLYTAAPMDCPVGCVKLYHKFEIEKIQFVIKSFYQKNYYEISLIFFLHKCHEDLHKFANFFKLPVAHTFKDMQSKIF